MISIVLSIIISFATAYLYSFIDNATWGIYVTAVITFIISIIVFLRLFSKKIMTQINKMQAFISNRNKKIQAKNMSMNGSNPKLIEREQLKMMEEAVLMLAGLEKYFIWAPMLKRQVNGIKFQLYYQAKNFKNAKKYIKDVFLFDANVIAMKLAFLFNDMSPKEKEKNPKNWKLYKIFKKGVWRIRNPHNKAFIFNTYAWILTQSKLTEEAIKVLNQGLKKTKNDKNIQNNLTRLQNNKPLSNSVYGLAWWGLFLEDIPKAKTRKIQKIR